MRHAGGYDRDLEIVATLVLVWLSWVLLAALRAVSRGDRRAISFVYVVFYFFFAVPLLLDLTIGPPVFTYQRGFIMGQFDRTTCFVYFAYLASIPVWFRLVGGPPRHDDTLPVVVVSRRQLLAAVVAMAAMPIAVATSPEPSVYLHYAAFVGHDGLSATSHNAAVGLTATLAVIAGVVVMSAPEAGPSMRLAAIPFVLMGIWLHGKRSIVVLAALMLLYRLWTLNVLRGRRFLAVAVALGVALGGFSYTYQTRLKRIDQDDARNAQFSASTSYVNYRIDFGRDAATKQTIFAELNPSRLQILEYRGQSLLFDATFFVPRSLWPGKPMPYAVYATSAMFDVGVRDFGWGITTSWLEEAIANFGWLGLVLGPTIPALMCRLGDRRRGPFVGLVTVTVSSLLIVLHLIAFMPVFLLWILMIVRGTRAPAPGRLGSSRAHGAG